MLKSSSTLENIWINRTSHRVLGLLWGGGESIRNHFSLKEQNDNLARQNFILSQQLREYQARDTSFRPSSGGANIVGGFRYIPASVVKMSRNSSHNYVILDKGSLEGVVPHSGIITDKGVVGIINAVDRHFSYGITMMNNNISVSARMGRGGICGPLVWNGKRSNGGILRDIPLHQTITPGDTVFTSGFSSIFPPDIALGIIIGGRDYMGESANADVDLFQDFRAVRYVTIVENLSRGSVAELEKKEEGK